MRIELALTKLFYEKKNKNKNKKNKKTIRDLAIRRFRTLAISLTYSGGPATFAIDGKRQLRLYKALTVRFRGDINV